MRMPADQLGRDRLDDVGKIEGALLLGHARMECDLQQQIAQLVFQAIQIITSNGVGNLIGFLECIRGDRSKGLLEIPRTAAARRAECRHNLDQAGNVA